MSQNRQSVLMDAGPKVPVVSLAFFQKTFLPTLSATTEQMSDIMSDVKKSPAWDKEKNKWTSFVEPPKDLKDKDNATKKAKEKDVFGQLKDVMAQISTSASNVLTGCKTLAEHSLNPDTPVWSDVFNSSFKPDGNFILNESRGYIGEQTHQSGKGPLAFDLVDLQEFKRTNSKADFNDVCFCISNLQPTPD